MTRNRALGTVVVWLLVTVALWLSDADPSVIALAGIVAVMAGFGLAALDLGRSVQPVRWPLPPASDSPGRTGGERVPRTLDDVHAAARSHPTELRPRLVVLVDDRLATKHETDRRATPGAADALLTPDLRDLVGDSHRRIAGTADLSRLVTHIEEL